MLNIPKFFGSVFYSELARIDSPVRQNALVYNSDKKYFLENRRRAFYPRQRSVGEFGSTIETLNDLPPVWVLVIQLIPGVHMVMPVFVGRTFFNGSDSTDLDTAQILIEMERMNGINPFEWRSFVQKWNEFEQAADSTVSEAIQ